MQLIVFALTSLLHHAMLYSQGLFFFMLLFCCVCEHGHLGNIKLNVGMANEA